MSMISLLGSFGSANVTFTRFLQMERHSLDLRVQNTMSMMSMVLKSLNSFNTVFLHKKFCTCLN